LNIALLIATAKVAAAQDEVEISYEGGIGGWIEAATSYPERMSGRIHENPIRHEVFGVWIAVVDEAV